METKNKFPTRYYFALLIALLLTILFWYLLFASASIYQHPQLHTTNLERQRYFDEPEFDQYQDHLPNEIGQVNEIDTTKIEIDSLSGRTIVSNLINVAVKNQSVPLKTFLLDLLKRVDTADYKIVYADSIINRVQLEVDPDTIANFKIKLRQRLNNYDLLVWDEVLFENSFNESKLNNATYSWYLNAINAQQAWSISTGNSDVIVAVIDNGFDINHPELKDKSVKPYNVVLHNNNVSPISVNHGTHVAATIIGKSDNNVGLVGIAPKCTFMPIKVSDQNGHMTNTYIIDGILYAIKNKASVINISLGMAISPYFQISESQQQNYINTQGKDEEDFWDELFKYANERNVTCVIAAGNSHIMAGYDPFQRSKYTIKVGAFDKRFQKADFSNYGEYVNIYAPGVSIYSAKPNADFEFLDGTSMASPIVAGSIALLKSKYRSISNTEIIARLTRSSKLINGIKIIDASKLLNER